MELGHQYVIFEGDAQMVVRSLQRETKRHDSVHAMIDDTIAFSTPFNCVDFLFCFRKCNQVVHKLAKWVVVCKCNEVWQGPYPS